MSKHPGCDEWTAVTNLVEGATSANEKTLGSLLLKVFEWNEGLQNEVDDLKAALLALAAEAAPSVVGTDAVKPR